MESCLLEGRLISDIARKELNRTDLSTSNSPDLTIKK